MKLLPLALLAAATLARAEPPAKPPAKQVPARQAPAAPAAKPTEPTTVTIRQSPPDDYTKAFVAYPLDLAKLDRYAAAVHQLRQENDKDPTLMADLRKKVPEKASFTESGEQLGRQPRLKAILDRHQLTGHDFVLIPTVVQMTGVQLFAEQAGHPVPADRSNAGFTALYKANREKVEALWATVRGDLQALGMR